MKAKTGPKSKYNKQDIIAAVIKMRIEEMASVKTIIDFLIGTISMGKTMAYQYLKWAREEIKEQYDLINPSKIEEAIGQYETALESARQRKDWRLWNDLRKEMNKIQGVYSSEKVDITSGGDKIKNITFEIVQKKGDDDLNEH